MANFIMIRYKDMKYPEDIPCEISEIAGHFDKKGFKKVFTQNTKYSLHTEYSFGKRTLDSELLDDLDEIKWSTKNGIPKLWKSQVWAKEFFYFIERLLGDSIPEIIEIHPPFVDYCNSIGEFLDIYETFERLVLDKYKHTKIFIENRCGTLYGKRFTISKFSDIITLCKKLHERNLKLNIVLDYPQLMSSERINSKNNSLNKLVGFNNEIKNYIEYFGGIHLWGKKKINNRLTSHHGNLDTLFNNVSQKDIFLESILNTFRDKDIMYMVLEVNSNVIDLHSIIDDLRNHGFMFI